MAADDYELVSQELDAERGLNVLVAAIARELMLREEEDHGKEG